MTEFKTEIKFRNKSSWTSDHSNLENAINYIRALYFDDELEPESEILSIKISIKDVK